MRRQTSRQNGLERTVRFFHMGRSKRNKPQYRLVLHSSAEECLDSFTDGKKPRRIQFYDGSGKSRTRSRQAILKAIKSNGAWGFYDHITGKIHLWFDKRVGVRKLVEVVAHEVAHSKQTLKMPRKKREMEATRAEEVAVAAFDLAILLLSEFTKRRIPWRHAA